MTELAAKVLKNEAERWRERRHMSRQVRSWYETYRAENPLHYAFLRWKWGVRRHD